MIQGKRVFLAHAKSVEEEQLLTWGKQLVALGAARVTSARKHWSRMQGQISGFKGWPQAVLSHHAYGAIGFSFEVLVFPSRNIGKATAQIAELALKMKRPCYLLERGDLIEVSGCACIDANDWHNGWELDTGALGTTSIRRGEDDPIPF